MTAQMIDELLKEHQASILKERRAVDRQPFVRPVRVLIQRGDICLDGFSRDISRNGISLIIPQLVHPGMIAMLAVHSLYRRSLEVRAENRWCDPFGEGWYASGWYFLESF